MTIFPCLFPGLRRLVLTAALVLPSLALADQPTVVYHWDAANWLSKYNTNQFAANPITNPDGTTGAHIEVTPRDALNPFNHIVVSAAGLKGGNEYTAVITFSVTTPTTYPSSFYMFARNSAGNQYDIWQSWIGLPGPTRTVALHMDLKDIPQGKWQLYMGIGKKGGLNVNSLLVYAGATSDGKTAYEKVPATSGQPAASELPPGLTPATGYTPITIAPPAGKGATISLATYGFVADAPGANADVATANAAALQKAIDDCKAQGASKLVIPAGIYRVAPLVSFQLAGLQDVTIDGQGATLIMEHLTKDGTSINISDCQRVVLENFFLDWDWNTEPEASLATMSNLSADKTACDFTFHDLDAAATDLVRRTPWRSLAGMDATTLVINDAMHFGMPKGSVITAGSAPNVLHVQFPAPVPLIEGHSYCIRHLYYDMSGFKVANSSNLTFSGVTIHSIPGMGWFFEGTMDHFQLVNCNIWRAKGSRNPLTTAADGIHVDQSIGNAIFQNCNVTGTGDDEMNIHSECYQANLVTDPTDTAKVVLMNCPSYQLRFLVGDPIEFFNADFSNLDGGTAPVGGKVAAVSAKNGRNPQTTVTLAGPVPAGLTPLTIVRNGNLVTRNVLIDGCALINSSGRGILLSAEGATISHCLIRNIWCVPIDLESDIVQPLWSEGRGASNVVIRDNAFENSNTMQRYGGALIYTDAHFPWGPSTATLYDRVLIEHNRFVNPPGPAVSLSNSSNVVVNGNEIQVGTTDAEPTRYANTLLFTRSSKVALGGNTWTSEAAGEPTSGVVYDPATTSDLLPGTNVLKHQAVTNAP